MNKELLSDIIYAAISITVWFFLYPINVDRLSGIKPTLHSWDMFHTVMLYNPFDELQKSDCQYWAEKFSPMFFFL